MTLGYLDIADNCCVSGWCWNPEDPSLRLQVAISINGVEIEKVVADRYREDVESAGYGDGLYGFEVPIAQYLAEGILHAVSVKLVSNGQELENSPKIVSSVGEGEDESLDKQFSILYNALIESRKTICQLKDQIQDLQIEIASIDLRPVVEPCLLKSVEEQSNSTCGQEFKDFNPYDFIESIKPILVEAVDKDYTGLNNVYLFSLITTVLNEEANIPAFVSSILNQVLLPNEVVIVDGGSTDNTYSLLDEMLKQTVLNYKLIRSPGASIAKGRNIAIGQSTNELVIVVDAGCRLDKRLCNNLVGCVYDYPNASLVGGIYLAEENCSYADKFIYKWDSVHWSRFLPSSRNVLIRKSIWEKAGGYPEFLTKTGEDTLFDISYRRYSDLWVHNKQAVVFWEGPKHLDQAHRLAFSYGTGDGESGFGDFSYYLVHKKSDSMGYAPNVKDGITEAIHCGYLAGKKRRAAIDIKSRHIPGIVIVLSGVPMTDSGGGQRGAQISLEFIRNGYRVIYVNKYPSFEVPHRIFFDIDISLLELYCLDDFNLTSCIERYGDVIKNSLVLIEFPHPDFVSMINEIASLKSRPSIIYDYIDNWDSSLGWTWYTHEIEKEIVSNSDVLIASASTLQEDLSVKTQRNVELVPNAFNDNIFTPRRKYPFPDDMPTGFNKVVTYTGALWGEWFDWDLLGAAIKELDDFCFVLIGNVSQEIKEKISSSAKNVFFLGLKPQTALPAYLYYSDVCIIPFKTDHITKYVNPLKVYEYLSMNKPVVSAFMEELKSLPNVYMSKTETDFVNNIKMASLAGKIENFDWLAESHSWRARVVTMLNLVASHKENPVIAWLSRFSSGRRSKR